MAIAAQVMEARLNQVSRAVFRRGERIGQVCTLNLGADVAQRGAAYQADLFQRVGPKLDAIIAGLHEGQLDAPAARQQLHAVLREHREPLHLAAKLLQAFNQYRATAAKLFA